MITTYKNNGSSLEILTSPIPGAWLNVVDPTSEEIDCLLKLGIPQDYISYSLDLDERARTERENGDLLIILRIPYFQGGSADIPYTTIPLGIILSSQYILTVSKLDNELIQDFASRRIRNLSTTKRNRFVLRLLLNTAYQYQNYLRKITKIVDALEDKLQLSTKNKEVLELLKYQKSLTYFATGLKSNELMMERLQRSQLFRQYEDDEDLLEDVLTENQQAIEMTNITNNNLSQMMDAFASIISNNLNVVMKVLASITIILSLPTMIASFYGMNVHLPFQNEPYAFLLTIGISFIFSISAAVVFVRRDWF
jgi:magnesium transporter